ALELIDAATTARAKARSATGSTSHDRPFSARDSRTLSRMPVISSGSRAEAGGVKVVDTGAPFPGVEGGGRFAGCGGVDDITGSSARTRARGARRSDRG